EVVKVGEKFAPKEIATELRRAGYTENSESPLGSYRVRAGAIEISPGPQSYHSEGSATIKVSDGKVESINTGNDGELAA
ncbi:hypothetical protein Q8G50_34525, partial [Klebsiella pneumoniae]